MVAERIPDLVKALASLSIRMRDKRVTILKDNEEHLAELIKHLKEAEEGDGFEDEEDDGSGSEDGVNSEEEERQFRKDMKTIMKMNKQREG